MAVNKVILVGRVGSDPEIKQVSGKDMAKFSFATSERYKDREGNVKEQTEWHSVVIFGPIVSVVQKYVRKGSNLYLEGKIQYVKREDKTFTNINVQMLQLLDKSSNSNSGNNNSGNNNSGNNDQDDFPF